jgi:hypothetical protein
MRLISTALALSLACGAASAQQETTTPAIEPGTLSAYTEYDLNSDGRIEVAEFVSLVPAGIEAAARACDTDANAILSQAEYDACAGLPPKPDATPAPR